MIIEINENFLWSLLYIFGFTYAIIVTIRPGWFRLPSRFALAETLGKVIIGVFATLVLMTGIIRTSSSPQSWSWVIYYIWVPFIVTGAPMAFFQIYKFIEDLKEAKRLIKREEYTIQGESNYD